MVEKKKFGMADGYTIFKYTIKNSSGASVSLINYGGSLTEIFVPDKNGELGDVLLGYDDLEGYVNGKSNQGALIGRYANRIADSKFTLNGKLVDLRANEGTNCLHGGKIGYNRRVWTVEGTTDDSVILSYVSPDGEECFPGNLRITVIYSFNDDCELKIEYKAVCDEDTVVNMTNHAYFNLGGIHSGTILGEHVQILADTYTPVDSRLIPTGEAAPVEGTVFDFREPKEIRRDLETTDMIGYDHNFMLGEPHVMRKAAVVFDPVTGREMTVTTDKPAIQFYTAIGLQGEIGKDGEMMKLQTGLCLETQYAPDTPNQPTFPDCTLKKGDEYHFTTTYKFSVRK